jgi:hypothetical protein
MKIIRNSNLNFNRMGKIIEIAEVSAGIIVMIIFLFIALSILFNALKNTGTHKRNNYASRCREMDDLIGRRTK